MIVFFNEDRAYLNWVRRHRRGFVVEGRHRPRIGRLVLHRATCDEIKGRASKRSYWTTGGRFKACALNAPELEQWAAAQEAALATCHKCRPHEEIALDASSHAPLTRLARDVLDYVLDVALIHFEHEHPPYRLCVGDVATCCAKTPGQLADALRQLVREGLAVSEGRAAIGSSLGPKSLLFPTPAALRTLEAFRDQCDDELQSELRKLRPEDS